MRISSRVSPSASAAAGAAANSAAGVCAWRSHMSEGSEVGNHDGIILASDVLVSCSGGRDGSSAEGTLRYTADHGARDSAAKVAGFLLVQPSTEPSTAWLRRSGGDQSARRGRRDPCSG